MNWAHNLFLAENTGKKRANPEGVIENFKTRSNKNLFWVFLAFVVAYIKTYIKEFSAKFNFWIFLY